MSTPRHPRLACTPLPFLRMHTRMDAGASKARQRVAGGGRVRSGGRCGHRGHRVGSDARRLTAKPVHRRSRRALVRVTLLDDDVEFDATDEQAAQDCPRPLQSPLPRDIQRLRAPCPGQTGRKASRAHEGTARSNVAHLLASLRRHLGSTGEGNGIGSATAKPLKHKAPTHPPTVPPGTIKSPRGLGRESPRTLAVCRSFLHLIECRGLEAGIA